MPAAHEAFPLRATHARAAARFMRRRYARHQRRCAATPPAAASFTLRHCLLARFHFSLLILPLMPLRRHAPAICRQRAAGRDAAAAFRHAMLRHYADVFHTLSYADLRFAASEIFRSPP